MKFQRKTKANNNKKNTNSKNVNERTKNEDKKKPKKKTEKNWIKSKPTFPITEQMNIRTNENDWFFWF